MFDLTYVVGDKVVYETFGGGTRTAVVTAVDVFDTGQRIGFDAQMADGTMVWGYDDQIVDVYPAGRHARGQYRVVPAQRSATGSAVLVRA